MADKFAALRKGPWYEFTGNDDPKCPHCGEEINVQEHELWQLYEGGDTDIECPHCNHQLHVVVHTKFTFNTDEQDEMDEEDAADGVGVPSNDQGDPQ